MKIDYINHWFLLATHEKEIDVFLGHVKIESFFIEAWGGYN